MAKVVLSLDGVVLKELTLTKERTTIGRKSHNDIHIDNLAVSGDHAVILSVIEDYFLEDLGSTNGTLVNGAPVKRHLLKSNDVIELGKYKLEFVGKSAPPAENAAEYEKTMVYRPSGVKPAAEPARVAGAPTPVTPARAAPMATPAGPVSSPASTAASAAPRVEPVPRSPVSSVRPAGSPAAAATARPATAPSASPAPASTTLNQAPATHKADDAWGAIRVLSGAGAGRERVLTKPVTTIGKPGVQVAMLTRRPQGYYLTHVEGAKHPQVNGQTIGTEPFQLNDHDVIELTGLKVEFVLRGGSGKSGAKMLWSIGIAVLVAVVVGYVLWKMRR